MNGQYKIGDVVLSNWKLVRLLGEGSYGRVYEAERSDFGTVYKSAVKIMTIPQNQSEVASARAEGMTDVSVTSYFKGFVEEIAKEFSLMAQLKGNSNIVSYEDHQVIPHTVGIGWDIIIRMELLTPLNSRLTGQGMSMRDIIKLGTDMCRALEICEKHNIIHRDIKPENIFINELGDYKLGDFGIARSIEQTNMSLSKKGTYNYMAPEVYKEEHYDKTVDIYSLGIVLYRLLNFNRTPFLPEYPNQISHAERENAIARRMRGDAIPMPVNAKNVLGAVVLKACAYNPADRYTSPSQFREDLEAVLRGEMPVYACQQKTQPIAQPKPPVVPDKPGTEVTHTEPAPQNGIKARIKTFLSSLKPLHKALIGGGAALVVLLVVLACVLPGGGKSDSNANSSDGSETEVTVVEKGNKTIVNNTDGTSFIQKLKNGEIVSVEFESEYGEPTEITFYGGDMSKPHEVIFEDDSGNRVRYYEFDRNGKIIIHTASKFDGSGRVTSETEYDSTGKAKNVSEYAYQGSETLVTCFDGNGTKIAERRLDADGRSILEKSFAGSSVVSWTETEYKPDGSYIVTEKNGSGVATTQTKCSSSGTDLWKAELIDGDISVLHDYANGCDWDYYYSENGAGSFVYRIATYDTVSWHWSDSTVQMGYTSAYVAIIDDPVENCIGYTYTQTNTGSSSCFGPWKAYFCNNGTWGSCAEFEIPEDSSGGTGTGTVEISFDSPVTLSGAGARFAGNRGFSYSSSCDITNVKVIDYEYYPD